MIFGHIAPSKVAAPNPGYNFRVVSPFTDDQLADGATRLDVAYTATEALLGVDANVISVDTSAGEARRGHDDRGGRREPRRRRPAR